MAYPKIHLLPGQDRRLRAGHPWVYSNELRMDAEAKALEPGAPVRLITVEGKTLGIAQFNPHSLIAGRIFSRSREAVIDGDLLERRLARALRLREHLFDAPHYRLIHAEADGLPGLIVDRFGDVVVCQLNSAGMDRLKPLLLSALQNLLSPSTIVMKNDSPVRELEGLSIEVEVVKGKLESGPIELRENGVTFFADPLDGQKTGWYFDQRDNRALAAKLSEGTDMLDLYCYGGGFAITALAKGASRAIAIDRSAGALALAAAAASKNGVEGQLECRREEGFAALGRLTDEKRKFGVVVADPPTFVKNKRELKVGLRGYRKLTRAAVPLVKEEGFFIIASCSHNVSSEALQDEVRKGLRDAGRNARLIRHSGADGDHPSHPMLPETAYLKCLFYALD